jgi:(p)ppGpp synthase/HD superfamily hydrolase
VRKASFGWPFGFLLDYHCRVEGKPVMPEHQTHLSLSSWFTTAVDYARHLHIETRKGSDAPSMAHLLGVTSLVMGECGHAPVPVTEDMVVAALLHDAVEDHGGGPRLHDIRHNFGKNVARMVEGLTDSFVENADKKESWEERKAGYIERLAKEPLDVQLISAADKLYNARAILSDHREVGARVWKRFKRGRDQQLWYFKEVLRVFKAQPSNRIVEEFERVVIELESVTAND